MTGGRAALIALVALALCGGAPSFADAPAGTHSCRFCHEDEATAETVSVHLKKGVTCESCHGGDPRQPGEKTSMDPARGYRGKLGSRDVVVVCTSCHAGHAGRPGPGQGYGKSVHVRAALAGEPRSGPLCTDCHGVHDIRARADPGSPVARARIPALCDRCHGDAERMNPFGLAIDQLAKYRTSHHGRAVLRDGKLAAAVCTDCHGAHEVLSSRDPISSTHPRRIPETCGRCHADPVLAKAGGFSPTVLDDYRKGVHGKALLEKGATAVPSCVTCHGGHAAAPPGFRSVATVCGSCHARNQEAHSRSGHTGPAFRGCIECHANHGVEQPGAALFDGACTRCHAAGTAGAQLAVRARDLLLSSEAQVGRLAARVESLAGRGYSTVRLRSAVKAANDTLLEVRPELHSFRQADLDAASTRVHAALEAAASEVSELEQREALARASLVVVTAFFLLMAGVFHRLVKSYDEPG